MKEKIIQTILIDYGIPLLIIKSKIRNAYIVECRTMIVYFLYTIAKMKPAEIGLEINRSRVNTRHLLKTTFQNHYDTEQEFRNRVQRLKEQINQLKK